MSKTIDSYLLGDIRVTIEEEEDSGKFRVTCNDGNYKSEFTIRRYEYENYKRHMNQRIKDAYKQQYESDS